MTEKNNMTVLGVYQDLTYRDSHMVADDTFQALRYEELLEDGYEVMGTITRDTTVDELEQIKHDMADKITPPKDDPVWSELGKHIYQHMEPRVRARIMVGTMADSTETVEEFDARLAEHLANGGDEKEFCYSVMDQWEGIPGWSLEEGARANEL